MIGRQHRMLDGDRYFGIFQQIHLLIIDDYLQHSYNVLRILLSRFISSYNPPEPYLRR